MADARDILRKKRDGGVLTREDMDLLLDGYLAGSVPETLVAAFNALVFVRGMESDELADWTGAMLDSGDRLRLGLDGPCVDKHSTGGVGDKVSLPLAPALAACGAYVPMISGRGLGHTGGTLDKLEAIPGLATRLSMEEIGRVVRETGAVIAAQTEELAPADRRLYSLRDETGLVESIPLIASSILSKKLAEGLDALVLDIKYGSGSFLPTLEQGRQLADRMLDIARRFELPTTVVQTYMGAPLGQAIGHTLEVRESIDCLNGGGPADLRQLVVILGGELLSLCGIATGTEDGEERISRSLDDGSALERFVRMVSAQGGDTRHVEQPGLLEVASDCAEWHAPGEGWLEGMDCRAFGLAVAALGGGRIVSEDVIDHSVGIEWLGRTGQQVKNGDVLARIHHRGGRGLEECLRILDGALHLSEAMPEPHSLVEAVLRS